MVAALLLVAMLAPPAGATGQYLYVGSMSQTKAQYQQTLSDMGRSRLYWNTYFQTVGQHLNTWAYDYQAAHGVTRIIVTLSFPSTLDYINSGMYDSVVRGFAAEMRTWQKANSGVRLFIRPLHEANTDWYAYGYYKRHNGNTVAKYQRAWRRIRSTMRSVFPTLPFVWTPNILYGGQTTYNNDYVGNAYTEYVGFDGYNHSQTTKTWKTPAQVYGPSLRAVRAIPGITDKLIVIAEGATSEPYPGLTGVSKAQWFTQLGYWLRHSNDGVTRNHVGPYCYNDAHSIVGGMDNDYRIYDSSLASGIASRNAWRAAMSAIP